MQEIASRFFFVDFASLCQVIKYFPLLNTKFKKKTLLLLSHRVQEPLNGKIFQWICIRFVYYFTTTYHDFNIDKNISVGTIFLQYDKKLDIHMINCSEYNIYSWGHLSFPSVLSHLKDILLIYWGKLNCSITCILSMK